MQIEVRPAKPSDEALIYGFIRDLADYERLLHEVRATQDDIGQALFAPHPRAFCDIVELDGQAEGFALWFYSFSTFAGRHGIYLEDLFVRPQVRGVGAGKALLRALARRCLDEGLVRLEWQVLEWNQPAIVFYNGLGATSKAEWITRQLTGDALAKLAEAAPATA
ncbi:MAG TPA: GNAT family N-acetyltransferase [Caulobacteraceae bacterium]|jgi:GNAT superfamily N-acetyltransferase|nr:GNAT family N-acetyltransferase [Caulobacteraceae bacterium]